MAVPLRAARGRGVRPRGAGLDRVHAVRPGPPPDRHRPERVPPDRRRPAPPDRRRPRVARAQAVRARAGRRARSSSVPGGTRTTRPTGTVRVARPVRRHASASAGRQSPSC
ncbi:hypothetical protein E0504_28040 [Parafrankia sp. BMG5.11]|nr:hypothetical protein E0504_28040 [Parafrankia sp. BMG5.11]